MILLIVNLCCVLEVSGFFTESPTNVSAQLGEDVIFRCSAENSLEPIVYSQWKSNTGSLLGYHQEGVLPGHQGRYSYIKQKSEQLNLMIRNVALDDDGKYECQMLHPISGPIRSNAYLNVLVPPQKVSFSTYQPNSIISVDENTEINVTCAVSNVKPEPHINWYLEGKKIKSAVQHSILNLNKTFTVFNSLVIKPGQKDHKKTFVCEVFHKETNLKLTANATLNVFYPPSDPVVLLLSKSRPIKSGDNATISCIVKSGNPTPELFWFYKNRKLEGISSFDAKTSEIKNDYIFTAASEDNEAEYECRANNSITLNSKKAVLKLKVEFPPTSVEVSGEHFILFGSSTVIQCSSSPSNPAALISWNVNGQAISLTEQKETVSQNGIVSHSNLTLNSNELADEEQQIIVECVAKNNRGSTFRQHHIQIISPPKLIKMIGFPDSHFFEGDVVNVTCETKGGNPPAELSWYLGNEKINKVQSKVEKTSSSSLLSFRLEKFSNGQELRCEAINLAIDKPLIEKRYITVYYPPRRVTVKPAGQNNFYMSGKIARLVCKTVSSNPPAQISWKFSRPNSSYVFEGDISLNETTEEKDFNVENVISFNAAAEDDGLVVYCVASHPEWKNSINASYILDVHYPPISLITGTVSIIVSEGESFKEHFTLKSNPPVSSWQWQKNGTPFDHTIGRIFARGAVLSGKQLLSTDAGIYKLSATNNIGTTNITIKVDVEYSARITKISAPIVSAIGDRILLECEAEANPERFHMIRWYKSGNLLSSEYIGNKKTVLHFNATEQNSGEYVCEAANGIGETAKSRTFVLVNSAPKVLHVPQYAKSAGLLGGTAKARCKVHAVPTVDFVWERDGQLIKTNSSKYSFVTVQLDYSSYESILWIKNIVPGDYSRKLTCIAQNVFGTDSFSIPIVFPTSPEQPLNFSMTNSTKNTISLIWEPGFNGGSDQIFEIKYKRRDEENLNLVNTTHTQIRVTGLEASSLYDFQIRSINLKGLASDWIKRATFSTLNENGVEIALVEYSVWSWVKYIPYLLIVVISIMLVHVIICCFFYNRSKKQKLREKTELVRTANTGEIRQVQMYGTMVANNELCCRDVDQGYELSEDENSVKTMIEVSPNGYMQPIELAFCDNRIIDGEFQTKNYSCSTKSSEMMAYVNAPYSEHPLFYANRTSPYQNGNNCGGSHCLSTFIKPTMGVRAGPIDYDQLDGDLV